MHNTPTRAFLLLVYTPVECRASFHGRHRMIFSIVSSLSTPSTATCLLRIVLNDSPDLVGAFSVWLLKSLDLEKRRQALNGRWVSCKWDVEELQGKFQQIQQRDLLKFRMAVEWAWHTIPTWDGYRVCVKKWYTSSRLNITSRFNGQEALRCLSKHKIEFTVPSTTINQVGLSLFYQISHRNPYVDRPSSVQYSSSRPNIFSHKCEAIA